MSDLARLRRELLAARDARAGLIASLAGSAPGRRGHGSLIFVSTNVPGTDKHPVPLELAVNRTVLSALRTIPGAFLARRGSDAIGPFALLLADASPMATKLSTVHLEEEVPWGRLIDLDVYDEGGRQVDRGSIGLGPRPCFLCAEPAHECIRTGRHPAIAIQRALARLLSLASAQADGREYHPATTRLTGDAVSLAVLAGARAELDLTPKPGLVDGRDGGSHPDLTYALMRRSIDLLPPYFDELVEIGSASPTSAWPSFDLPACVEAGKRAEAKMLAGVGSNTHRGLIFLGGLAVLAACPSMPADAAEWRTRVALLAGLLVGGSREEVASHGSVARQQHGVGGIRREAIRGLPAVFDHALPLFTRLVAGPPPTSRFAPFAAMASLMQHVEDTTAIHRCGMTGLARLRDDGAALQRTIERGDDPRAELARLNEEYRALHLTMGGVADCLAITFAAAMVVR